MIMEKTTQHDENRDNKPVGTPMWRLMTDPYIAIIAGALVGTRGAKTQGHHSLVQLIEHSKKGTEPIYFYFCNPL